MKEKILVFDTQVPKLLFAPVCAQGGGGFHLDPNVKKTNNQTNKQNKKKNKKKKLKGIFLKEFRYETCTRSVYT